MDDDTVASQDREFIALSIGYESNVVISDGWMKQISRKDLNQSHPEDEKLHLDSLTIWDQEGECIYPLPIVHVMMIERTDHHTARRIAVGWIYLTKWAEAEPRFEMVYLE